MSDTRPFPIQAILTSDGRRERCTIPWWLAEEAYKYYAEKYGTGQSLERLAERGGFGRWELLALLRRDLKHPKLEFPDA